MLTRAIYLSLFLALPLAKANAADQADVDSAIRDAMRAWQVPGVAVAIVKNDDVLYLQGHGVRAIGHKESITPDTLFPLASCSKAFTSAALALLVDEGKLGWDEPVRRHVPWFRLNEPLADGDVRLRDLLCHRTGLRGHELLWYHAPWTPAESIRRAGLLSLDRPFRTAFQYQSTMFSTAGFTIAAASGQPWEAFVRNRLLVPLGMSATFCTEAEAARSSDRAASHWFDEEGQVRPMPAYPLSYPDAAGSVSSTARDLTRWLRFQLSQGCDQHGHRLVSAANLGETQRPQMVIPIAGVDRKIHPDTVQMSYGMGWVIQDYRGVRLVSHAGVIDGIRCHLTLVPSENIGIAILANLHRTRMNQALSNVLVDLLLDLPAKDWNHLHRLVDRGEAEERQAAARKHAAERKPDTKPALPLTDYVGTYEHPAYGTATVTLSATGLEWKFNDFQAELVHDEGETFELQLPLLQNPPLTFHIDAGAVRSLLVGGSANVRFERRSR